MLLFIIGSIAVCGIVAGGVVLALWLVGQQDASSPSDVIKPLIIKCAGCNKPVFEDKHRRALGPTVFHMKLGDKLPRGITEVYRSAQHHYLNEQMKDLRYIHGAVMIWVWETPETYRTFGAIAVVRKYLCAPQPDDPGLIPAYGADDNAFATIVEPNLQVIGDTVQDLGVSIIRGGVWEEFHANADNSGLYGEAKYTHIEYRISLTPGWGVNEVDPFKVIPIGSKSVAVLLYVYMKNVESYRDPFLLITSLAKAGLYGENTWLKIFDPYGDEKSAKVIEAISNHLALKATKPENLRVQVDLTDDPIEINAARFRKVPTPNIAPWQIGGFAPDDVKRRETLNNKDDAHFNYISGLLAEAYKGSLTETEEESVQEFWTKSDNPAERAQRGKVTIPRAKRTDLSRAKWARFSERFYDTMMKMLDEHSTHVQANTFAQIRRAANLLERRYPEWDMTARLVAARDNVYSIKANLTALASEFPQRPAEEERAAVKTGIEILEKLQIPFDRQNLNGLLAYLDDPIFVGAGAPSGLQGTQTWRYHAEDSTWKRVTTILRFRSLTIRDRAGLPGAPNDLESKGFVLTRPENRELYMVTSFINASELLKIMPSAIIMVQSGKTYVGN